MAYGWCQLRIQWWRRQWSPVRGGASINIRGGRAHRDDCPVPLPYLTAGGNYRVDAPGLYSLRGGSLKKVGGRPVMVVSRWAGLPLPVNPLNPLRHRHLPCPGPGPARSFPDTTNTNTSMLTGSLSQTMCIKHFTFVSPSRCRTWTAPWWVTTAPRGSSRRGGRTAAR